ncbi:MAG: hypothetical protein ACRDOO_18620 [Actinomadura sp.]
MPSAIVLSHEEQLTRLVRECPAAAPAAVVAGDICFDRLTVSLPWRERYRTVLGLRAGRRLIVVTSTWGSRSLLGSRPELFAQLLAELPADEYQVAAVVHPNVWHGHGPWQLRAWLADCRRAGMLMIPPREGWRAALVAADGVVGDHGSVTLYGAALGRPTLLGAFGHDDVDPETAIAELGRRAPHLAGDRPLREQIETALADHDGLSGLAEQAFAARGRSAEILRDTMYDLLGVVPPARPARLSAVPPAVPEPRPWDHGERPALLATTTIEAGSGGVPVVRVERYPVETADLRAVPLPGPHLVVDAADPDHRLRRLADVLVHQAEATAPVIAEESAAVVAEVTSAGGCLVRAPGEAALMLCAADVGHQVDPGAFASAVHAWTAAGRALAAFPEELIISVGRQEIRVRSGRGSG